MPDARRARPDNDDGRRRDLIAAATRVIARDGIAAATTRRIATEAGLPLGAFHYWFTGKEELLEEVLDTALKGLGLPDPDVNSATGQQGFIDSLRATWHALEEDDRGKQLALYELTTFAIRNPKLHDLATRQYRRYRETGSYAVEHFLGRDVSGFPGGSRALGQLVSALFDGIALAWLADPEQTAPDEVFVLLDFLIEKACSTQCSDS